MTITSEDVPLPSGVVVRIRTLLPADLMRLERLLAAPDAMRLGLAPERSDGALVADYAWADRIVGHGVWHREHGPRARATITVAGEFANTLVAAHLLVRLARLADAALIPKLVVPRTECDALTRVLRDELGAETIAGGALEFATRGWPAALARLNHLRSVPGDTQAVGADGSGVRPT